MTAAQLQRGRPLTGWHVLAIFVGGFSIIIAVNLALAFNAVRTFPGKETESSYVASQNFDSDRAAQEALGWAVQTELTGETLRLAVQDANGVVQPKIIAATLGRATTVADDMTPDFAWDGHAWTAPVTAGPGNWNLRIEMRAADGTLFRRRIPLRVTR
ncbi:FixH family protein [Sulfitobacter sp. R18_1]|uniref:FixH family protein n=1 Tax=Sulfitobacter sp. R18_1 TaxID=2821104 RepID=UPI001ADA8096|nr:FixH family protein [Sulfitobacter sp. R18_1]MBO9430302.1 FixH family protein [Sulfitobacter sp. R18_1]